MQTYNQVPIMGRMPNKKTVFETKWFSLESEEFPELKNLGGKPIYRIKAPDCVVVLPFDEKGNLILIKQFRPVVEKETLELPAGGISGSETPEEAAKRELEEETGYMCNKLIYAGKGLSSPDRIRTNAHVFLAENCVKTKKAEAAIDVVLASPEKLRELVKEEKFNALGCIGVLLFVKWKLNFEILKFIND